MTMRTILFMATAVAAGCLAAQTLPGPNVIFQQAGALSGAPPAQGQIFLSSSMLGSTVTGKPFSAIEQRHSLQVLGDGTRIERTDTDQYYRDSEGRTRIEQTSGANAGVTINDPVAGFMVTLNPADKTAHKLPLPPGPPGFAKVNALEQGIATRTVAGAQRVEIRTAGGAVFGTAAGAVAAPQGVMILRNEATLDTPASEDLGSQTLGVTAQGSRTTLTIPVGQIGNDRELKVVSERWFSADLQMTIKSVNNDPRFGETTFELTNINQAAPDPSLFAVPADYTVSQPQVMEYKGAVAK